MRYRAFLNLLAQLPVETPAWHTYAAGYRILRMIEQRQANTAATPGTTSAWRVMHEGLSVVPVDDAVVLWNIVATLESTPDQRALIEPLSEYASHLEGEGQFALAGDVFEEIEQIVVGTGVAFDDSLLAATVYLHAGMCATRGGAWERAERCLDHAGRYAPGAMESEEFSLHAKLWRGILHACRGDLERAETMLDDVIDEAQRRDVPVLHGHALRARGGMWRRAHVVDRALVDFFEAYKLSDDNDDILIDVAMCLALLGHDTPARRLYGVIAEAGQSLLVRTAALAGLVELAVLDDDRAACEAAWTRLQASGGPAESLADAGYYWAMGMERWGTMADALQAYEACRTSAHEGGIRRVADLSRDAIARLMEIGPATDVPERPSPATSDMHSPAAVGAVVDAVLRLCDAHRSST